MQTKEDKIDLLCDALSSGSDKERDDFELGNRKQVKSDDNRLHDMLERIEVSPRIHEYAGQMRNRIWLQINAKIDRATRYKFWIRKVWVAAAVLLLLIISNYFSYNEGYQSQNSQLVTLVNPLGTKSSIVLSDGTKVILNAGTVLTYPITFVSDQREVEVKGEAFFEVVSDKEHPFIVYADDVQVKVLGTKFNVKAYEDEENVEVALVEGRVGIGLKSDNQLIRMEPKELVRFNKKIRTFDRKYIDLLYYTSWKDGKFYFNSMALHKITKLLERNFNVQIHIVSDKLKNMICTGDFVRGENLEQILRVMTFDKRVKYRIEGDQVYISEK